MRLAKARADGLAPPALAQLEEAKLARFRGRLVDEVVSLQLPVVEELSGVMDPAKHLGYLAAGRRASTLQAALGAWRRMRDWLETVAGVSRPRDAADVVAYLEARAAEPCGKTVLGLALDSLRFLEMIGRVPEGARLGGNPWSWGPRSS